MKIPIGSSGVAALAAVGLAVASPPAQADVVVDTADGTAFAARTKAFSTETTSTTLAQGFILPEDYSLNSVTIRGYSQGSPITLAITDAVGPSAVAGNILFQQTFAVAADATGASMKTFSLGGVSVGSGSYYLVVMADTTTGFEWTRVSRTGAFNTTNRGQATYPNGSPFHTQTYSFSANPTDQIFVMSIDGTEIPAPGAASLAGLCGLAAARRRRR